MPRLRNAFLLLAVFAVATFAVDSTLLNMVMPDAKVVSGVQVDQAKASPFGQYVLSQIQIDDTGFNKFLADTGFDPRRDLNEIIAATGGTASNLSLLVLGKGVFNPARILNAARTEGAVITTYKGIDLITSPEATPKMAVAFLDAGTAAFGNIETLKAAIDRRAAGPNLPAATQTLIRQLAAANDAWFLSTGPIADFFAGKLPNQGMQNAMSGNLMQAILQASGGVKFGAADVRISGEALTRSDKDATALADVVRFLVGMIQMNRDSNDQAKQVASILDTLQLSTQASTMKLSLSIPETQMEKMFMPQMVPGAKKSTAKRASVR